MPPPYLLIPDDFSMSEGAPYAEGLPCEWAEEDVAALAALTPEQLLAEMAKMLDWYVQEDDVQLQLAGNDHWIAGYFRARALVAAAEAGRPV